MQLIYTTDNRAPVVWIMQGDKRLAGVHWGLHEGRSDLAQQFADKLVQALNKIERKNKC